MESMEAPIRAMTAADAARVAELAGQLGYPSTAEDVERRFGELAGRDSDAVLVAVDDGTVIGWIHVCRVASLAASDVALIGGLVVDEDRRSDRIGAALLAAAEAWARDRGAGKITVASRITREGAHRFYLREGYELTKTSHVFAKSLV
jgi:GNAT superfamily N-acetyltransferase